MPYTRTLVKAQTSAKAAHNALNIVLMVLDAQFSHLRPSRNGKNP